LSGGDTLRCDMCPDKPCRNGDPCVQTDSEKLYVEPEDRKILVTAAEVEARYYGLLTRFEEIMEFSRRMGYRKIGIAFCIGMSEEARTAAEILESEFEVATVCCKVGGMPKEHFSMPLRTWLGKTSCNPIEQARFLESENCDLAVVMGLCVGHDSLFYKWSNIPVTTFVAKDRKLAHNPVAALYCPYLRNNLSRKPVERPED